MILYYTPAFARNLEHTHQWELAVKVWKVLGYHKDAEMCQYIADAIKDGDAFRAKVLEVCGPEPARETTEWLEWFNSMEQMYLASNN